VAGGRRTMHVCGDLLRPCAVGPRVKAGRDNRTLRMKRIIILSMSSIWMSEPSWWKVLM
jgi:hypothetical protein